MEVETVIPDTVPLRDPSDVMRLARLGSMHQSRLSFMRTLLRKVTREGWEFSKPVFSFDERGVGRAVYTAAGPDRTYSLVCFGHDLPSDQRSDRVIAHAWDSTFTLTKGIPSEAEIDHLAANVPYQEAGRVTDNEVSLSRANRSVRLFDHVLNRLAAGQQPDVEEIDAVGYLMRTTAVYGSGKFGAADHPAYGAPFQTEMLTVFLIRAFTLDLVEHMAKLRAPGHAVKLDPTIRRQFGVGNSTGLGMAPFLINHPVLLNNWIIARETGLARVRAVARASEEEQACFVDLLERAKYNVVLWRSTHPIQVEKLAALTADLDAVSKHVQTGALTQSQPWDALMTWAEDNLSLEGQEHVISLMMEPYGDLVDGLTDCMGADETVDFPIRGGQPIAEFKSQMAAAYGWALDLDWEDPAQLARCWYVSEEKLEPRLGELAEEPLEPYEQPLSPARDIARMAQDLAGWDEATTLAAFLLQHPEHRHVARRIQTVARRPYAEINDNTIASDMLPIDLLRCKLSFFGATHFDPRSDRWVRITMFRNAPFPHELTSDTPDDWAYPCIP